MAVPSEQLKNKVSGDMEIMGRCWGGAYTGEGQGGVWS